VPAIDHNAFRGIQAPQRFLVDLNSKQISEEEKKEEKTGKKNKQTS
jgi:hypothetical protein